jgi:hypothetical protein
MLEYHSRLHHLDVKRQRQQQRKQEAAAAAAAAARRSSGTPSVQHPQLQPADVDTAGAAAAAGHQHEAAGLASEHEAAGQLDDGCYNDAASDVQVSA